MNNQYPYQNNFPQTDSSRNMYASNTSLGSQYDPFKTIPTNNQFQQNYQQPPQQGYNSGPQMNVNQFNNQYSDNFQGQYQHESMMIEPTQYSINKLQTMNGGNQYQMQQNNHQQQDYSENETWIEELLLVCLDANKRRNKEQFKKRQ